MHTGSQTSTLDTSSNAGFHINDSSTPQLPHLVVPSQAALGSSRQEEQQQQQQRPERLPRCSTVSLQTELATPALVVFSGGTAFNSVAGTGCGCNQLQHPAARPAAVLRQRVSSPYTTSQSGFSVGVRQWPYM